MKPGIFQISPARLTFEIIEEILEKKSRLELSPESVELIRKSKAYLDRKIQETEGPIYGPQGRSVFLLRPLLDARREDIAPS